MESYANPVGLNPLMGHCYNLKLSQSIQSLLSQLGTDKAESSTQLAHNFYELIQARVDPPLESIWVFVSLAFRTQTDPKEPQDPLDRILTAKHLFQSIQSCSSSCDSAKSVALLAPVVYEVHNAVAELFEKRENENLSSSKRERKAIKEVNSLVDSILGYVSLCSSEGCIEDTESGSVSGFSELVRIWAGQNTDVKSFLPLVSGEICERVCEEGLKVGYLAGVVAFEAFLLKLCLSLRSGILESDLVKELKIWAVGSITVFGNFYFFETLVRMLLEKTLPLEHLLSSEDEFLLRKILYDAIILVEYSFLNPERTIHLPADRVRSLAMARLLIAHEAIAYFRELGDQRKSISYINAFSNSQLASQIIKWIKNQSHAEENESKNLGSSPTALIKWLVNLQNLGVCVFDDNILYNRAKLIRDASKTDFKIPSSKSESKKVDSDLLFFVDNRGEEVNNAENEVEMGNETLTAAFVAAARSMKSADDGGKKRSRGKSAEKKRKPKLIKYEPLGSFEAPIERSLSIAGHNSESSGSEVENPVSDGNDTDQSE